MCLVAGYIGCGPSEVLELPARDFDLLARFYREEPWGAWRDNLHAAIISREVRSIFSKRRTRLDDFFFMAPELRREKNLTGLVEALKGMAGGKRVHISEHKPPKAKRGKRGRPGKTGSPPRGAVGPTTQRARQSQSKN